MRPIVIPSFAIARGALSLAAALLLAVPAAATAQTPVDQADPSVVEEQLRADERQPQSDPDTALPAAPRRRDAAAPPEMVVAGAIRIEGATELPPAAFASAIEPYLGRPLGPDDLVALTRDVAAVARAAGFGLATAWIPSQNLVTGVLRVVVDEGRIDDVEVEGGGREAVERRLAPLATGRPLRTAELERRLLLAGDLAGVSVGRPRIERRQGRNILKARAGLDRVQGRATIDNSGSPAVGPVRARLGADFNSLVVPGDRLSVGGAGTPIQPREFQLAQASYTVPIGRGGTEASVRGYVGHSDPGASLRDQDIAGDSAELEALVSHPILRSRAASLWATAILTVRDSRLDRGAARVRDDRIVTATATLFGNARFGGGRLRTRLSYVQGLDSLSATVRGDPLASRRDGGGPFSKVEFWAQYERPLGRGFSMDLRGQGQIASRPLLASEEMGLGGRQFLRGFDYWQLSGDEGAAAGAEVRYDIARGLPRPLRRLQPYLYADAGRVTNIRGGFGGGSLASAGGGVRAWLVDGFEAGLELGLPLTDGLFNDDPDPRLSFTIGSRF
ncbi:MAG TPA: ShlB/FhaC/HecB family hemolysin secretion/activation protein [Allosphingosinicella sp.]|nr:ShlB/FhaC/HecB family hemolysin secretion/activation protein [Allosphingosinicella sp.]